MVRIEISEMNLDIYVFRGVHYHTSELGASDEKIHVDPDAEDYQAPVIVLGAGFNPVSCHTTKLGGVRQDE